jgi:hypothetical protein
MKKIIIVAVIIANVCYISAQSLALKTNALYLGTATFNLGIEGRLGRRSSIALNGAYNPFTFADNAKWKHFLIQPEFRYWFCESFTALFLSLDAALLRFNVGGVSLPYAREMDKYRYDGIAYMGGLSYGYSSVLGKRLNLELMLGFNVGRAFYDRYQCPICGDILDEDAEDNFLSPKLSLSLIYMLK